MSDEATKRAGCRRIATRLIFLLGAVLASAPGWAEAPPLFVVPFELVDEQPEQADVAALQRRLAAVQAQFVDGVRSHGHYTVVAPRAAVELVNRLRAQRAFLYDCKPCKGDVGKAAGVRLVAVGWVQKVSNLILNINVEISDADSGHVIALRSVDIRGNTDESWARGMRFLLRRLAEGSETPP